MGSDQYAPDRQLRTDLRPFNDPTRAKVVPSATPTRWSWGGDPTLGNDTPRDYDRLELFPRGSNYSVYGQHPVTNVCMIAMTPSIRPITFDDAESVARLYAQSAAHLRSLGDPTDFRFDAHVYRRDGFGDRPAFSGIVAVLNDEVVGHLLYSFGYDTDRAMRFLFVIDLAVDERVRGQGIGRALMEHAVAICRAAGGADLFWAVYARNHSALEFYRRLGATAVSPELQFMTLDV
jgi:ribosomal protein S18 acetylase RimI-like enzyme